MRHVRPFPRWLANAVRLIAVGVSTISIAAGCGPKAGAFYWLFSNPKIDVPAEFTLTQGPILILVDVTDSESGGPEGTAGDLITQALIEKFGEHEINQRIIPREKMIELRRVETDYESLAADRMGKKLGAEQVLFIKVEYARARIAAEGIDEIISGASCKADVRVVNAKAATRNEVRLWPTGRPGTTGHIIETDLLVHQARAASTPEDRARLLADQLADQVAKLFYDHKIAAHDDSPES